MSEQELARFYQLKSKEESHDTKTKRVDHYGYDADGNLIEQDSKGALVKTIPLPIYRSVTLEELDIMSQQRNAAIANANQAFDHARIELYEAIHEQGINDPTEILKLNRKVAEADSRLQQVRFPLRNTKKLNPVSIRELDFNQPNEIRKYPYHLMTLETSPFLLQDQYVRIGVAAPKPMVSISEAKEAEQRLETIALFSDPSTVPYGELSLSWPIHFIFNTHSYQSAKQAIAGELALHFKDETHFHEIQDAEDADAVTYSVDDLPGGREVNEAEWNKKLEELLYAVNQAKFLQSPDLSRSLLESKNAILGAYEPNDTFIGIGISIHDPQAKNRRSWTGQNKLGQALMRIREELRASQPKASVGKPAVAKRSTSASMSTPSMPSASMPTASVPAARPAVAPKQRVVKVQEESFSLPSVEESAIPSVAKAKPAVAPKGKPVPAPK
jgi:ribA/ribD-fused uncharacterized protein